MIYSIKAIKYSQLEISKEGQPISTISWKWWNASKIEIPIQETTDRLIMENTSVGRHTIYRNGRNIGYTKHHWKGHLFLYLKDNQERSCKITIKPRNFFSQGYDVYLEDDVQFMMIKNGRSWFKTSYTMEIQDSTVIDFPIKGLVGILGYIVCNLLHAY